MLNKLWRRIQIWILGFTRTWEVDWLYSIPKITVLPVDNKLEIKKDVRYWQEIVNITDNVPFLNEMRELQEKYEVAIRKEMSNTEPNYVRVKHMMDILSGIKKAAHVIAYAHNKTVKLKEEG